MTEVVLEPIIILYYIPGKLGPGYEGRVVKINPFAHGQ